LSEHHRPEEVAVSTREFTFEDVREILVNRIGVPAEKIVEDPNLSFEEIGLDSLAFVEIQLAMQQEYGFTIPDEDAEQIGTIGEAIEYTNRRLNEQGS
jgi:acyl carrier protein